MYLCRLIVSFPTMKRLFITLFILLAAVVAKADSIFIEGFEYANHDGETPIGWVCNDASWLCGYLEKDHNRIPHNGNWYAYTNADESWMFMEMFMSHELKYRFYLWAISDGEYDIEIWAGRGPSQEQMTQLLLTKNINSDEYYRYSEYVETMDTNYQFFGIHAVAHEGAYNLTIDDIYVDMVARYNMEVLPVEKDTVMYPGTQAHYHYTVQNTGYEELQIFMTPHTEFFTDFDFYADGNTSSSFPTVPNQTVDAGFYATLMPTLTPGTLGWVDIMFTVSCDCVTRMATMWVTVLDTKTEFPIVQNFDADNFMYAGWVVMGDGPRRWIWSGETDGMLLFKASETDCTSLLFSPKMLLNGDGNTLSFKMFHTNSHPDKDDRVNVYYNTELSLENATLLGTINRHDNETGWAEHLLGFESNGSESFIIIEAVGDFGENIMIDDIVIYNTPLSVEENETASFNIYPNPSNGQFTVEGDGIMTITNTLGQVVFRNEVIERETVTLEKGIYFISINGMSKKLVVR